MKILQVTDFHIDPEARTETNFHTKCGYKFIIQEESKATTDWGVFEELDYTKDPVLKDKVRTILNN
jgi:hypothetical protein